jgi:hypothetical protein
MQHLSLEELARCADEAPTAHESEHLAVCSLCAVELEALRDQTRALAALPGATPPDTQWPQLRSRLMAEGLMAVPRAGQTVWQKRLLRIAAALALFAAGGASGALLTGGGPAAGLPGGTLAAGALAATPAALTAVESAATPAEATERLHDAERLYLAALTRYAELTDAGEPVDPVTRLAALEGIVLTAQAALREAPADPVINGYLLTALGQREAMLRQISMNSDQETWF